MREGPLASIYIITNNYSWITSRSWHNHTSFSILNILLISLCLSSSFTISFRAPVHMLPCYTSSCTECTIILQSHYGCFFSVLYSGYRILFSVLFVTNFIQTITLGILDWFWWSKWPPKALKKTFQTI